MWSSGSIVMDWFYQKAVLARHGITTAEQLEQKLNELRAKDSEQFPPNIEYD